MGAYTHHCRSLNFVDSTTNFYSQALKSGVKVHLPTTSLERNRSKDAKPRKGYLSLIHTLSSLSLFFFCSKSSREDDLFTKYAATENDNSMAIYPMKK
jgi:hypothetical protein